MVSQASIVATPTDNFDTATFKPHPNDRLKLHDYLCLDHGAIVFDLVLEYSKEPRNYASVGCSRNATNLDNKTASIEHTTSLSCVSAYQRGIRQHFYLMSKDLIKFFIIILTLSMFAKHKNIEAATLKTTKQPINKWHESFFDEMCTTEISWNNACRGQWLNNDRNSNLEGTSSQNVPHYQALRILKNAISTKFNELRSNTTDINVSDMKEWGKHRGYYKFLPRLKRNATLSLRTWHRQMQTYVAGFTYLRHAQLYYDFKKYNQESNMSKTLKKFEESALQILCEIETTINITRTHRKHSLRTIKLKKMSNILKFRTSSEHFYESSENCRNNLMKFVEEPAIVNEIDLKYAKFNFLSFLRTTRKIVKRKIAARTSISRSNGSLSRSQLNSAGSGSYIDNSHFHSKSYDGSLNSLSHDEMSHSSSHNSKRQRHGRHHKH